MGRLSSKVSPQGAAAVFVTRHGDRLEAARRTVRPTALPDRSVPGAASPLLPDPPDDPGGGGADVLQLGQEVPVVGVAALQGGDGPVDARDGPVEGFGVARVGVLRPSMASRWASRTANRARSTSAFGSFATASRRRSRSPAAETASSVASRRARTVESSEVASGQRCSARAFPASASRSPACARLAAACSGTCWRSCQQSSENRRRSSDRTGSTPSARVVSASVRVRRETRRRSISAARSGSRPASARTASASRSTRSARWRVSGTPCRPAPR